MCIRYQILYSSKKIDRGEHTITHIGGKNPLEEVWRLKVAQVIEGIQSGKWEFYMNLEEQTFPIHTKESKLGSGISTVCTSENLILELPDCPQ